MFKFRNEKGLTLIELLITISVLAVVSAIALPVINNVVTSSNSNALQQTIKDADAFIKKYSASGVVIYDGLKTLTGYVDSDGDNVIEANEKMDSLTLDSKYSISATGSAQVGGSYTGGGVTAATITSVAGGSSSTNPSASPSPSAGGGWEFTLTTADLGGSGSCNVSQWMAMNDIRFFCISSTPNNSTLQALSSLNMDEAFEIDIKSATTGLTQTYIYTAQSVNPGSPYVITINETVEKGEVVGLRLQQITN